MKPNNIYKNQQENMYLSFYLLDAFCDQISKASEINGMDLSMKFKWPNHMTYFLYEGHFLSCFVCFKQIAFNPLKVTKGNFPQ